MQAFGLSRMKGRLGSDQERRRDVPRPNEKAPKAPSSGATRRTKTSNAAVAAIGEVRPGPIRIDAHEELSDADNDEVSAEHSLDPSISPGDGRR